ncbi:NAD-dependent epimerase/dehydratase family protein [Solwaraspora sp. WMMB335]|uniref:polysaccharide biosynthesis C-terminal domain-containing protein n=1 Tax=Solwaraspora sp. WMMB335 TaxID=3404118 RepID=UPI003B92A0A8
MSHRLVLTGGNGFLGWHLRVLCRALGWPEPAVIGRAELADPLRVADKLTGADRLVHLAGVNRGTPDQVAVGNVALARAVAEGLRRCQRPPQQVAFANSIQAGNGTPYGDSKAAAAALLAEASPRPDAFIDLLLPNLFGEHGRPDYNSVVATFCRRLADDVSPQIRDDRPLDLVHAGDAAAALAGAPTGDTWSTALSARRISVGQLAGLLGRFATDYRGGEIPALADRFETQLFNTYRSHVFPQAYPMPLIRRGDHRGDLVEVVRVHGGGGGGQVFCSTTRPGASRGEHFHLAKIERFAVLAGSGEIRLRRVASRETARFPVSGERPVVVDMPTMWAHHIVNTGNDDLVTLFWADQVFDPARPDTYPELVEPPQVRIGSPAPTGAPVVTR